MMAAGLLIFLSLNMRVYQTALFKSANAKIELNNQNGSSAVGDD